MRRRLVALAAATLAVSAAGSAAAAAREPLGLWHGWGAFRDDRPARCYAIARPENRRRGFASVAHWPTQAGGQLHLRLSRPRSRQAAVTLTVGERRFTLTATDSDAWAPDARTDAAAIAAMRDGRSMSVETVAANGRPFADVYALAGAPTAIDAAAVGCLRR